MASPRIIVLRPQPGATATAQALRANGHDPLVTPLFAIEPVAWTPADPQAYDALLVGSANVFRHGGPALADLKGLPVYAVGGKTARMASDLGFRVRGQGTGYSRPARLEKPVDPATRFLGRDQQGAVHNHAGEPPWGRLRVTDSMRLAGGQRSI